MTLEHKEHPDQEYVAYENLSQLILIAMIFLKGDTGAPGTTGQAGSIGAPVSYYHYKTFQVDAIQIVFVSLSRELLVLLDLQDHKVLLEEM